MVQYIKKIPARQTLYTYWNMFNRCYSAKYQEKNPKYKGCSICEEWLTDKKLFQEWMKNNYYKIGNEQIDLDKDIICPGNKIYSPDTCIFVPHKLNVYYELLFNGKQAIYNEKTGKYSISIMIEGKKVELGKFDTEDEALRVYAEHKTAALHAKAEYYKGMIPEKLYDILINTTVTLDDVKKSKKETA